MGGGRDYSSRNGALVGSYYLSICVLGLHARIQAVGFRVSKTSFVLGHILRGSGRQEGEDMKSSLTGRRDDPDRLEAPKTRDVALRDSLNVGFGPTFDQVRGVEEYDVIAPWLHALAKLKPRGRGR